MGILLIIVMIAVVGPLALAYGVDSRDTSSRPRSWWPAARR
jgi:hypothetical protein